MFSKSWSMELKVVFTAYPSVNATTFGEDKEKNRKQQAWLLPRIGKLDFILSSGNYMDFYERLVRDSCRYEKNLSILLTI